jgi:uncharacterized protein YecA (UPF0149 family)
MRARTSGEYKRAEERVKELQDDGYTLQGAAATGGLANLFGMTYTAVREKPKAGRNDPCPCGTGIKYKKCCLLWKTEVQ